jgi:hypothetical protein
MPDYGLDMWCTTDIDPLLADVTGEELMSQVCLHRLFTRKGALLSAPSANTLDARDFLSGSIGPNDIPKIQALCQGVLLDDERIQTAVVVATFNSSTRILTLQINGTGANGPFSLTLAVSSVTVQLLSA